MHEAHPLGVGLFSLLLSSCLAAFAIINWKLLAVLALFTVVIFMLRVQCFICRVFTYHCLSVRAVLIVCVVRSAETEKLGTVRLEN